MRPFRGQSQQKLFKIGGGACYARLGKVESVAEMPERRRRAGEEDD
jgi:hypothetical protein